MLKTTNTLPAFLSVLIAAAATSVTAAIYTNPFVAEEAAGNLDVETAEVVEESDDALRVGRAEEKELVKSEVEMKIIFKNGDWHAVIADSEVQNVKRYVAKQ